MAETVSPPDVVSELNVFDSAFWEMCQDELDLAAARRARAGAESSLLTSWIFVVESSLWHACEQQMGTLCCSCLHVMGFLAPSSVFLALFLSLWASLKRQCIPHLWTDTFSNVSVMFCWFLMRSRLYWVTTSFLRLKFVCQVIFYKQSMLTANWEGTVLCYNGDLMPEPPHFINSCFICMLLSRLFWWAFWCHISCTWCYSVWTKSELMSLLLCWNEKEKNKYFFLIFFSLSQLKLSQDVHGVIVFCFSGFLTSGALIRKRLA